MGNVCEYAIEIGWTGGWKDGGGFEKGDISSDTKAYEKILNLLALRT